MAEVDEVLANFDDEGLVGSKAIIVLTTEDGTGYAVNDNLEPEMEPMMLVSKTDVKKVKLL